MERNRIPLISELAPLQEVFTLEMENMAHYQQQYKVLSEALGPLQNRYEHAKAEFESVEAAYFHTLQLRDRVSTQISSLRPVLSNLAGLIHPIRRCSDDVLRVIFQWVVNLDRSWWDICKPYDWRRIMQCRRKYHSAALIGQVSRRWRNIAHSTPSLWSQPVFIDLRWPKDAILNFPAYKYLARWKVPCDLFVVGIMAEPTQESRASTPESITTELQEEMTKWADSGNSIISTIFLPVRDRNFGTVHLQFEDSASPYQCPVFSQPTGSIEDLTISVNGGSGGFDAGSLYRLLFRYPPCGRLSLVNVLLADPASRYASPNLRHLRVSDGFDAVETLGVLFPYIETLEFNDVEVPDQVDRTVSNVASWTLPHLRTLVVGNYESMCGAFEVLGDPHAPNLTSLTLHEVVRSSTLLERLLRTHTSLCHFDFVLSEEAEETSIQLTLASHALRGIFNAAAQLTHLAIRVRNEAGVPGSVKSLGCLSPMPVPSIENANANTLLPSLQNLWLGCGSITATALDEFARGRDLVPETPTIAPAISKSEDTMIGPNDLARFWLVIRGGWSRRDDGRNRVVEWCEPSLGV